MPRRPDPTAHSQGHGVRPWPQPPGMVWIPGGNSRWGPTGTTRRSVPSIGWPWMGSGWTAPVTNDGSALRGRDRLRDPRPNSRPTRPSIPAPPRASSLPARSSSVTLPARSISTKPGLVGVRAGRELARPDGPDSTLDGLDDHPVVHVAYGTSRRTPAWAGKALPTEAEWERAARGGLEDTEYAWGERLRRRPATWRTPGRASSRGRTSSKTATDGHLAGRQPSRPTATACST